MRRNADLPGNMISQEPRNTPMWEFLLRYDMYKLQLMSNEHYGGNGFVISYDFVGYFFTFFVICMFR